MQWYIKHRRVGQYTETVHAIDAASTQEAITEAVTDYEIYEDFLQQQQQVFVLIRAESDGKGGYVPGTEETKIDIHQTALMLRRALRPSEEITLLEYLLWEYCDIN